MGSKADEAAAALRLRAGRNQAVDMLADLREAISQAQEQQVLPHDMPSEFEQYCLVLKQLHDFPNKDLLLRVLAVLLLEGVDRERAE